MDDLIRLTSELIHFRSTPDRPGRIAECADFVAAFLDRRDIAYQRSENQGVPSIWVVPQAGFAPVLLMSHLDVVDGPPEIFNPRVEGDRLWGRGSIDDKYAVALSLLLLEEFINRAGGDPSGLPFGILITGDEEVGGRHGARAALKQIRADFAIALDGGSLGKIVIREKGILQLKLVCRGVAAHGARPWLGENAIEKLMADYSNIRGLFTAATPDHWHRTLNWGRVRAGEAANQVPDRAEAVLDIRYTEADDPQQLLADIRGAVAGEVEVLAQEPLFEGGDSPYLERLRALVPETEIGVEHGASDARFLSKHSIPGIVWGADGDMSQHSAQEHLNLPSVAELRRILTRFFETAPLKE
jgi:succinyl-diaminopimelate desuccinylase